MRYAKPVTMLVLVALLTGVFISAANAQVVGFAANDQTTTTGLSANPMQWSDGDLPQLVDLAVAERITVPELQAIWDQLSPEQREQVGFDLAAKVGMSANEWTNISLSDGQVGSQLSDVVPSRNTFEPEFAGEIWRQFIENRWTNGQPPGSTFARMYFDSPLCDDDPSDHDWTFLFDRSYEWYSRNPDGLRWTTSSSQVYLAFMAAYGGNLNAYSFGWNEARLCLGTGGVNAAGGTDKVKSAVFLHPNN